MQITNQPTSIQFGEIFAFLFALFCLCVIAALVMIHQNPTPNSGKSSLCQCFQSNADDSDSENLSPAVRNSGRRASADRLSRYSDEEFYIIHANQTRSIVKLDQIQNSHFIYV